MTTDLYVSSQEALSEFVCQHYLVAIDGLVEGDECLLFSISVNESQLDFSNYRLRW